MPEIHFSAFEKFFTVPDKIVKLVNFHANNGDYMRNFFGEQFAYGHREILLKYSGIDFSAQLLGTLQHGVLGYKQVEEWLSPRYMSGRKSFYWVYSHESEKLGKTQGHKNVVAIGAPWLYLRKSVIDIPTADQKEDRVLVMPSHSQAVYVSKAVKFEKRQQARAFREVVGSKNATVCLHAIDFCDPELIEAYVDEEFDIICIGSSSFYPAWTEAGNRIGSLGKLMRLMGTHSHMLTNSYGSHLFYAIDMGMSIGVYPEIGMDNGMDDISGRTKVFNEAEFNTRNLDFLKQNMSEALNQFTKSQKYRELSNEILGSDAVMSPGELEEALVYRKNVYPISGVQPW